jgi:SNF2 family DNA or RNA helicase
VVVTPASVKFNWVDEIKACMPAGERGPNVYVIDGNSRKRANTFTDIQNAWDNLMRLVVIINYDLLLRLSENQLGMLRSLVREQACICDESHYLKNSDAERTKLVKEYLMPREGGASIRLLLSGTPIRNHVIDVYSQVELVRPGTWSSETDFKQRHMVYAPVRLHGGKERMLPQGAKNMPALNRALKQCLVRRKKENVLDLPPKILTYPKIPLEGELRTVYRAMRDYARLELDKLIASEGPVSIFAPQARSGVHAALRCEQIAQGFVGGVPEPLMNRLSKHLIKYAEKIPGRPKELMFPTHPKVTWLMENVKTLLDTGHSAVIYSRFLGPMFWLNHNPYPLAVMLHGGMSAEAKNNVIKAFRETPGSVMLCQVSIAEGFNLTECQDVIFWGRDWSPSVNHQAEDRCHRIGTKGTVNIQVPIVLGTIEEYVHKKLAAKDANAQQALASVTLQELRDAL